MDSMIVAKHNRRELALRLLGALAPQRGSGEGRPFEVVVVADGSTDGTAAALRAARWPFPLHVIEQPQSGVAAARNRGTSAASGVTLVFIDDDIVLPPAFLGRLHASIEREHAGGLVYRLWLVLWSAEWWRGVLDAGSGELAYRELDQ